MGIKTNRNFVMGNRGGQEGFTIIEVTLFLALTAFLAVLLMGGWTTMLNTQHYKDSVKSLQSFVQQQYNLVYNVENARSEDLSCNTSAEIQESDNGLNKTLIGQSDCVVMGRYMHINGNELRVYSIVGIAPVGVANQLSDSSTDVEVISAYTPNRVNQAVGLTDSELSIPWQANVVGSEGSSDTRSYVIAIIRAPESGLVHTFVRSIDPNTDVNNLPGVVDLAEDSNAEKSDTNLCLDAGAPLAGGRMGVVIRKGASSQSSVQTISDDEGIC